MIDFSFVHASSFTELATLLTLAAVVGFLGLFLRQPMIVSFIVVGVLAGPSVLGILQSRVNIELLAQLGIALLLFLVGLKLDVKLMRTMGLVSLVVGIAQVVLTSTIGFILGIALGLDTVTSFYIAVALTFSSTIIVVKLLSDKKEADSLYGKITIGFLIVQDLVVVLMMIALSAFSAGAQSITEKSELRQFVAVVIYGIAMLAFVGIFIRYFATKLINRIVHLPELLVTFAIGWAALLAALGSYLGFSRELGGLLAGVSLASTPYREVIIARLAPLRDFLLLFFFVALGTQLHFSSLGTEIFPVIILTLFVLIAKPLIIIAIMSYMGYRNRTAFLTGLTLAQISEFSLIFMAMGQSLGYVNRESVGLVTFVGLLTIALSVYMFTYSSTLYFLFEPLLKVFERKIPYREETKDEQQIENQAYDVILFGLGRYGSAIGENLRKEGYRLLAIDFNPQVVRESRNRGHQTIYGDACDEEFIDALPIKDVRWVISALPQHDTGLMHQDPRIILIEGLKSRSYGGKIAVSGHHLHEKSAFRARGADLVFLPFYDAADRAIERLKEIQQ